MDGSQLELESLIRMLAPIQKESGYRFLAGRKQITSVSKEELISLVNSLKDDNKENSN